MRCWQRKVAARRMNKECCGHLGLVRERTGVRFPMVPCTVQSQEQPSIMYPLQQIYREEAAVYKFTNTVLLLLVVVI